MLLQEKERGASWGEFGELGGDRPALLSSVCRSSALPGLGVGESLERGLEAFGPGSD